MYHNVIIALRYFEGKDSPSAIIDFFSSGAYMQFTFPKYVEDHPRETQSYRSARANPVVHDFLRRFFFLLHKERYGGSKCAHADSRRRNSSNHTGRIARNKQPGETAAVVHAASAD